MHDHDEKVGHFALGHLARVLAEAEYAIDYIGDLTALNLGDLRHSIGAAAAAARTAFGAAALLREGAELAEPWNGSSPTRTTPKGRVCATSPGSGRRSSARSRSWCTDALSATDACSS